MTDEITFGRDSPFVKCNDTSICYPVNSECHTPDAGSVGIITKMTRITKPSLLSESHTVVNRSNYLNYDSASESEESDDEMSTTSDYKLDGDEDELLLLYIRKFLELNIEMTRFASILKSKIKEKSERVIEGISSFHMPPKRNLYRNYYRFYPPYFKDETYFPCPSNEDVKIKEEYGFISGYRLQSRVCSQWKLRTRTTLCHYIKKEAIEREVNHLKSLQKTLSRSIDEDKEDYIKKIDIQIEELKNKSLSELLEGKDDWEFDWDKISVIGLNSVCSGEECSRYWHLYLKPSINKERWSSDEDNHLAELVVKYKNENWDQISKELGTNRSPFQIFVHFQVRFCNEQLNKNNWSDRDERKFLIVVKSCTAHGVIDWIKVSRQMERPVPQLIKKFCLNRHYPKLVKGRFTKEEDMLIVSGIQEFGYDSVILSSLLKHRTTTQILSRYRRLIPDKTMSGPWELHEDEMLIKLVNKYGFGQWSKIAKQFITRSRTQIRQRYGLLRKRIEQNQNFNVTDLRRRRVRKSIDKSKNCDNIIQKVLKKVKRHCYDMSDKDCSNKLRQINDLKTHIFPRQFKKPFWSEENLLQSQFYDFFQDKCNLCKAVRKSDLRDIKKLAEMVACILIYFKVDKFKMVTKNDIQNDDRIDERTKSVLEEIMPEGVLDFQFSEFRKKLIKSANTVKIYTNRSKNLKRDRSCPSTSMDLCNTNKNEQEVVDYHSDKIDCPSTKKEDTLVDLKARWMCSEIECKEKRISQMIKGNFDEFEFGIFKFIKEEDHKQIEDHIQIDDDDDDDDNDDDDDIQADDDSDLIRNCRNISFVYKLPLSITTIIFLRTVTLAKTKLKEGLMDKGAVKVNEDAGRTLNKNEPIVGLKYTKKFKGKNYVSQIALNMPAAKLLFERAYALLLFTNMIVKNVDLESKPQKRRPKKQQTKISTNERLKKKRVREVYCQELHQHPRVAHQKKTKIIEAQIGAQVGGITSNLTQDYTVE